MKKSNKPYFHPKALVDKGASVGSGTRVWAFAHLLKGAKVGSDCNIGDHCFVEAGSLVGDRVTIKNGVSIWEKVLLEDDVFVGPNAVFTNDLLPISRKRLAQFMPTIVRKGACIGANAVLVCGVEIGAYAFVGAGAVVTTDIPDYALVYGNPARFSAYLCCCRKKLAFKKLRAVCDCGMKYEKRSKAVRLLSA